jgi:CheY-like chemotaxis protein
MNASETIKATARILVVDDTELNCSLVRSVLEVHGYEVSQAMRGSEELLSSIFQSPPDVIILDVMMPGINGLSMCQRLRDNIRTLHVPILMVTSLSDRSVRLRAVSAGANDVIVKPIDTKELYHRVRNALVTKLAYDAVCNEAIAKKVVEKNLRKWWTSFIHGMRVPVAAMHHEILLGKSRSQTPEQSALQWQRMEELSYYMSDQLTSAVLANNVASGMHSLSLDRCNLSTLLHTAIQFSQKKYPEVQITQNVPECFLTCDRVLMQKAFEFLLKHMAQSSLRTLSIHVRAESGSVEIALRSDGPSAADPRGASGIYPSNSSDISGPYPFQDMDMSFCSFVFEAHGGKMKAESSIGANQVWISLPEVSTEWKNT